ncbi:hypothetical protein [Amaricoccus solimangrovi]|uniref:Uncharacterized protein n=1 Tax=Amaricoccus solimangrovi TaxID=2589815 RepID=A0A501X0D9_9RHOB|nr:hypothetical protein [Amaricoccus solimangrovi]TPE53817.1 hypothetical protein FJM51_01865 [Amaricoccus solimangrovi]
MDLKDIRAHAKEDLRRGLSVPLEDRVIGALVAMPFAGFLGIWWNALTWWPNMLTFALTVLVWLPMAAWVAGHLDRANAA